MWILPTPGPWKLQKMATSPTGKYLENGQGKGAMDLVASAENNIVAMMHTNREENLSLQNVVACQQE
jgi:acyl CoA:acetate/3-ketoacid CoA transferase beta subunit